MRKGHTLLELTTALLVLAVLLDATARRFGPALDRWAVRTAADEVVSTIEGVRGTAVATAGAVLSLDPTTDSLYVLTGSVPDTARRRGLGNGVDLVVVGSSGPVDLRFNPLGLGVVASRRIRLTRNAASEDIILSSFGRVRRR